MESTDESKKTDIKNHTRYYFDDIIEAKILIFVIF